MYVFLFVLSSKPNDEFKTLNPKDMIHDTIRNFSSQYANYATQGDDRALDGEIPEGEDDIHPNLAAAEAMCGSFKGENDNQKSL